MCRICRDPDCKSGERCNSALTSSAVYRQTAARIGALTGSTPTPTGPGMLWDGRRPAFLTGVRDAIAAQHPDPAGFQCTRCGQGRPLGDYQLDHVVPWRAYLLDRAKAAAQEADRKAGVPDPIPLDFAQVIYSDPDNLTPLCKHCNAAKSDTHPATGRRARMTQEERHTLEVQHRAYEARIKADHDMDRARRLAARRAAL